MLSFVSKEIKKKDGSIQYYLQIYQGTSSRTPEWARNPFFGSEEEVAEAVARTWEIYSAGGRKLNYYEGPLSLESIRGKFDFGKELEAIVNNLAEEGEIDA